MAEETGSNYQDQQQFISDSPWSAPELMEKVGVDTNNLLGAKPHQALCLDESSEGKAGKHSVGVSRQYNGKMGEKFVVDVHKDQMAYLAKPEIYVPVKGTSGGRMPTRPITDIKPVEVQDYLKTLRPADFKEVNIRKGTKGWLKAKIHIAPVWVWDNEESQARERALIIRKPINKKDEIKYCLSNFTAKEKTAQEFAFMQAQRFWIERAFEDQKGELGMSDYQVRKHNAWCHHQALVMLAMLYVNKQKVLHQENTPLLSLRDVRLQLIALLKNEGVYLEKEIDKMLIRHGQRINDINRYYPDNGYFLGEAKLTK